METWKEGYRLALKAQRNPKPRGTGSFSRVSLKPLKGLVVGDQCAVGINLHTST